MDEGLGNQSRYNPASSAQSKTIRVIAVEDAGKQVIQDLGLHTGAEPTHAVKMRAHSVKQKDAPCLDRRRCRQA